VPELSNVCPDGFLIHPTSYGVVLLLNVANTSVMA
jgi:hypothetical protein